MKIQKINIISRILLAICGGALLLVLQVPMWRIELNAPQYPEGLNLLIYASKLGGNVDIINGLNHYIGMKTLHSPDFFEFTLLPYLIIFFATACIAVSLLGRRKWLNLLFILFVCFGVVAMIDFWRWEYNYGHNLNPEAAIIVPGMAYQPPLIGFKQLLNFGAYSTPDIGGWIFVAVGVLLLLMVYAEWRIFKKNKIRFNISQAAATLMIIISLSGCTTGPEALVLGKDNCNFCKMTISDNRFGAELITRKGKIYKYDDSHCLLAFLKSETIPEKDIADIYIADFSGNHALINTNKAFLLQSDSISGPMNGHIIAFESSTQMKEAKEKYKAALVVWKQLYP